MEKDSKTPQNMNQVIAQTVEQTRAAIENYLGILQKSFPAAPWATMNLQANTDLSNKVKGYIEQNIAAVMEHAQKLMRAKDLQDVLKIQTEFMQAQLSSLSEQAKDITETTAKTATEAIKPPFGLSS
jgi:phasin family protein